MKITIDNFEQCNNAFKDKYVFVLYVFDNLEGKSRNTSLGIKTSFYDADSQDLEIWYVMMVDIIGDNEFYRRKLRMLYNDMVYRQ